MCARQKTPAGTLPSWARAWPAVSAAGSPAKPPKTVQSTQTHSCQCPQVPNGKRSPVLITGEGQQQEGRQQSPRWRQPCPLGQQATMSGPQRPQTASRAPPACWNRHLPSLMQRPWLQLQPLAQPREPRSTRPREPPPWTWCGKRTKQNHCSPDNTATSFCPTAHLAGKQGPSAALGSRSSCPAAGPQDTIMPLRAPDFLPAVLRALGHCRQTPGVPDAHPWTGKRTRSESPWVSAPISDPGAGRSGADHGLADGQ